MESVLNQAMGTEGFIIMGTSGCGKSTVGRLLAEKFGWQFLDADDFHPAENIQKMQAGIPLSDGDRLPWLRSLNSLLSDAIRSGAHPVLACSALRESYRQELLSGGLSITVVYLRGTYEEILERVQSRQDHFMPAELLRSQFDTLEEPANAWIFDISQPAEEIVEQIVVKLKALNL